MEQALSACSEVFQRDGSYAIAIRESLGPKTSSLSAAILQPVSVQGPKVGRHISADRSMRMRRRSEKGFRVQET